MPDEKIDQKRPVGAESEPKPIQQRHVDDAVDDSFPASDPPAWTTSGSKSVAAECEPEALNEIPTPPGQEGHSSTAAQALAGQAAERARDLYRRGQTYWQEGRRYLPQAERYYRHGADAVSRPVQEHPLATVLAAGALGCALGWMLGRRRSDRAPARQWHSGSTRRSRDSETWQGETQQGETWQGETWSPAPRAARRDGRASVQDDVRAASQTNNSF